MTNSWIIDKSAYVRMPRAIEIDEWILRIGRGLVYVHPLTLLELGFSARNSADWLQQMNRPPVTDLLIAEATPSSFHRAQQVQGVLAQRGYHRSASPVDLAIAATAELASLTVLHVDKDFDLIAGVTGQPMERLKYNDS